MLNMRKFVCIWEMQVMIEEEQNRYIILSTKLNFYSSFSHHIFMVSFFFFVWKLLVSLLIILKKWGKWLFFGHFTRFFFKFIYLISSFLFFLLFLLSSSLLISFSSDFISLFYFTSLSHPNTRRNVFQKQLRTCKEYSLVFMGSLEISVDRCKGSMHRYVIISYLIVDWSTISYNIISHHIISYFPLIPYVQCYICTVYLFFDMAN